MIPRPGLGLNYYWRILAARGQAVRYHALAAYFARPMPLSMRGRRLSQSWAETYPGPLPGSNRLRHTDLDDDERQMKKVLAEQIAEHQREIERAKQRGDHTKLVKLQQLLLLMHDQDQELSADLGLGTRYAARPTVIHDAMESQRKAIVSALIRGRTQLDGAGLPHTAEHLSKYVQAFSGTFCHNPPAVFSPFSV
jgi:hypothetical protein